MLEVALGLTTPKGIEKLPGGQSRSRRPPGFRRVCPGTAPVPTRWCSPSMTRWKPRSSAHPPPRALWLRGGEWPISSGSPSIRRRGSDRQHASFSMMHAEWRPSCAKRLCAPALPPSGHRLIWTASYPRCRRGSRARGRLLLSRPHQSLRGHFPSFGVYENTALSLQARTVSARSSCRVRSRRSFEPPLRRPGPRGAHSNARICLPHPRTFDARICLPYPPVTIRARPRPLPIAALIGRGCRCARVGADQEIRTASAGSSARLASLPAALRARSSRPCPR